MTNTIAGKSSLGLQAYETDSSSITPVIVSIVDSSEVSVNTDDGKEGKIQEPILNVEDSTSGETSNEQYLHGTRLWACMVSVLLCLFLLGLDQTIVITIISEVGNKFNAIEKVGWLSSGFLLAVCIFAPFWGNFSISFGRKTTMIISVVIFEIGCLICALANSMELLIAGRFIAGIGGGGIQSTSYIICAEIVPIEQIPLSMSCIAMVYALSTIAGPLVGGAFTTHVTWRWSFYINLPVGAIALLLLIFSWHPPKSHGTLKEKLKKIDYLGTILIIVGLVLILLALTFGASYEFPWRSGLIISFFIVGALFLVAFCIWNFKYSHNPLIPLSVVKVPQINAAAVGMGFMFAYFTATTLYLSIYFQIVRNRTAFQTGIALFPIIIGVVLSSGVSGYLLKLTGHVKLWVVFAGILGPIGVGLLTLYDVHNPNSQDIGLQIVLGVALGIQFQALLISAQIKAPTVPGGKIMTISYIVFARCLGGAISANLADLAYASTFVNKFRSLLSKLTDPTILSELGSMSPYELLHSSTRINSLSIVSQQFVKNQYVAAINNVYYMCIAFACVSLVGCILTTNKMLPQEEISNNDATVVNRSEKEDVDNAV